jgi:hypothetical protein
MNLATMYGLVSQRLNEGQTGFVSYPKAEIIAAVNEAQRFFCLLTLGLEITQTWTVPGFAPGAQNTIFRMLTVFPDWICPLRITTTAGAKVRPARLEDLAALDSQWMMSLGAPKRYASRGVDLVALYPQPSAATPLAVTYARAPVLVVNDGDVPELPDEYHPRLVDYGIYRLRQGEGAQEFEAALALFGSFLDGATHYGNYVRSRNLGSRYDTVPIELDKFDRSQVPQLRKNVMPGGKPRDG